MGNFGRKYNPNAKYTRKTKKRKTRKSKIIKTKTEEMSLKQFLFCLVIGIICSIIFK